MAETEAVLEKEQKVNESGTYNFEKLSQIDVSKYTEKKNGFTYLSWANAVQQLKTHYPNAQIITKRFPEYDEYGNVKEVPYMKTNLGYFVEVEVIVDGVSVTEVFPVTDYRNKPIAQPTTFDINSNIQRAKVKAIAGHGLGLYIYAGEDLPITPENESKPKQQTQSNQPRQQNNQSGLATQAEKQAIKDAVAELAMLNSKQGAGMEEISAKMGEIFSHYKVTPNLTSQEAARTLSAVKRDIATFHQERMRAQGANQQNAQPQGQAEQPQGNPGAPSEDLEALI